MVYIPIKPSSSAHGTWCLLLMLLRSLAEVLRSCCGAPCRECRGGEEEVPEVVHVDMPLNRALVAACPSLRRFRPAWWARGAHAQTMAMAISPPPSSKYRREMLTLPGDGVQVALDWKEDAEAVTPTTPIVLCLHGMGGCRKSLYLKVFTDCAMKRGYRAVVYNRRGHGSTSLLPEEPPPTPVAPGPDAASSAPKIFPKHSNMDDMMHVVAHLCAAHPHAPKYLIGFSCGANLCVNYLAAVGDACPFLAAGSVSNGYDIWAGTSMIRERDRVADGVAAQFLKTLMVEGRLEESRRLAEQAGVTIDWKAVMKSKSIQEFEELLVVPAYGYSSLRHYYDEDSCHLKIKSVQSPLLCVCARKDPLVCEDLTAVPRDAARENPHILTVITKHGGHMGWIVGLDQEPWYVTLYFEYIEAVTKLTAGAGGAGPEAGTGKGVNAGEELMGGDGKGAPLPSVGAAGRTADCGRSEGGRGASGQKAAQAVQNLRADCSAAAAGVWGAAAPARRWDDAAMHSPDGMPSVVVEVCEAASVEPAAVGVVASRACVED